MSPIDYMDRFTEAELIGIYAAAEVYPEVKIWIKKFERAPEVSLSDLRTIAGVQALEAAGLIGVGRANEILGITGGGDPVGGFAIGDAVRITAPFNMSFPDEYTVEGFEGNAVIVSGVSFDPMYLEQI